VSLQQNPIRFWIIDHRPIADSAVTFAVLVGAEPTINGTTKIVLEENMTYHPNSNVLATLRDADVGRLLVAEFAVKQVYQD
jgi:hypothetical protein